MRTKLSVFCDRLIEAGSLAAVVILPMIFNVYTTNNFPVSKVGLLRSIALVMTLAWGVRTLEERKGRAEQGLVRRAAEFLSRPMVLPALVLAVVHVLTSLTSVWPHGSFWGSYERRQGTYTTLSYIAIFLLALETLRAQEQLERIVTMIVLASLPVSLYAFIQFLGLVPKPWGQLVQGRVPASLGNPIFVGAYIIMVIPLTVGQLIRSISRLRRRRASLSSGILVGFYALALLAQSLCLVLTQSRGPFLGLLIGLFLFLLLLTICRDRRQLGLAVIGLAFLLGLFLVILNLPNTPLTALKDVPYVGRLGTILEATTLETRTLIWKGAVRMSTANPGRALIGYGPETINVAFYPYLLPELVAFEGPTKTADRIHNSVLDAWVTTGLIGVIAHLLLFGSVFYYGLKWLGLIKNRRQRTVFFALSAAGTVLGVLIPWALGGTLTFAGLGISLGLVAATFVHLILFLLRDQRGETEVGPNRALLIALLAGIVAHFVEIQAGIAVIVTQAYFWVYVALMVVVGVSLPGEQTQEPAPKRHRARKSHRTPLLPGSLLIGLLLITMAYAFVTHSFSLSSHLAAVVLMLVTWLLGGAVVVAGKVEGTPGRSKPSWSDLSLTYALVSLGCLLLFVLFHVGAIQYARARTLAPAAIVTVYYLFILLGMVAVALTSLRGKALPHRFWRQRGRWLYPILTLAAMVIIVRSNLNVVKAEIHAGLGDAFRKAEQWDRSVGAYRRAVDLAPMQDHYHRLLGYVYFKKGLTTDQQLSWLERSHEALERARQISPLDPDHYDNLGDLYHGWSSVTEDPAEKAEKLETALSYYQRARDMAPSAHGQSLKEAMVTTYISLAESYASMGEIELAIEKLEAARELAPANKKAQLNDAIAELEAQKQ